MKRTAKRRKKAQPAVTINGKPVYRDLALAVQTLRKFPAARRHQIIGYIMFESYGSLKIAAFATSKPASASQKETA